MKKLFYTCAITLALTGCVGGDFYGCYKYEEGTTEHKSCLDQQAKYKESYSHDYEKCEYQAFLKFPPPNMFHRINDQVAFEESRLSTNDENYGYRQRTIKECLVQEGWSSPYDYSHGKHHQIDHNHD